jgi:putative intracellular protease/amidase
MRPKSNQTAVHHLRSTITAPVFPSTSTEFINVMAHYHRAEIARMAGWRDRIDRTTNWAITVVAAMQTARNSPALGSVDPDSFDTIFLPGGHGPMWDAANDETLARIIGAMFDQGKVVAAVCHGPAGLVKANLQDGRPVIDGRRVSAFTNSEEEAVGLTKVVPFMLEDRLKELGGRFERGPDWQPFAVQDGNLITGQNPQSSELVAQHVLTALRTGG